MQNRTLAFASLLIVLALAVSSGGQQVVDTRAQHAPKQSKFIEVGKYVINKEKVCYIEKIEEKGWVHIHFSGTNGSTVILSGQQAKSFLQSFTDDER